MSGSEGYSLVELNRPKDWNNLAVMDKKHVPILDAPAQVKPGEPFEVQMKVGGIDGVEHPNALSHYIVWVELYAGERFAARVDLAPIVSNGYKVKVTLALDTSAALRARAFCNLHGLWEGKERAITVK